ncbi:NADH-quinone oxidoreductase subunit D [Dissostichus eleginoides]|uniref:NADH-quinone oxidoreductase subunit D n=1 Tax=Dissostichus eleginoides TaxID=100907 RepID=A0AAD9C2N4_DISEL|nr:NADH-quinone oxidoreductase subunit D [Dissostichus eleginoides]
MFLCFSTAEYACSSWCRSRHTKLVDTALNDTCRIITGCVKTTPVPCLYALAGISPPHIRRLGIAQDERRTQETDIRHPLHGHVPPHAGSDPKPVLCRQSCPSRQPNKQQGPTFGKMNGKEMTHELLNGWTEESHQRKASLVATTLAAQPGSHLIDCVWNRGGAKH